MNIKEMQKRLGVLIAEGQGIYRKAEEEERELTEDETKRLGEIETEADQLEAKIASEKRKGAFQARVDRVEPIQRPLETGDESNSVVEDRSDYNAWPAEEADQFFRAVREFSHTRRLPSGMHEELRNTFVQAIEHRAPTGQGTIIDAEGGFLVPSTISSTVLRKIHSEGQVVSRTQNVPVTVGNTVKWNAVKENARTSGNRYGGITVGRTGEAVAATGSKASFEQVSLEVKKLTALVYFTEEQLEDGPQALTIVNDLVPRAFTFVIEDEIVNGLGGAQMEGVLVAPALITVNKEGTQAAATVVFENISKMWNRLAASSRANSVWFIHQDVEPQLDKLFLAVGTGGVPVYLPAGGLSSSPFGTLKGRPVIPIEHCATLGTVGDIILADMSQYLYATKGGLRSAQSMHVKFAEGETAMRFVLRNDGKSWWPAALTPAKGSNTVSPFVVLQTRS